MNLTGTRALAEFVADLRFDDIPAHVIEGTKDLMVDWLGSALAGKGARPVVALEKFAAEMGPRDGPSEIMSRWWKHEPSFRRAHQRRRVARRRAGRRAQRCGLPPRYSCLPGGLGGGAGRGRVRTRSAGRRRRRLRGRDPCRRIPRPFALQDLSYDGHRRHARLGGGRRATPGLDADATQHALGSAGTQAAGLWEFLRDAADSKQLHTAKAAADGLLSAYLARSGVTGARRILEGAQGLAAGISTDADPSRLTDELGTAGRQLRLLINSMRRAATRIPRPTRSLR